MAELLGINYDRFARDWDKMGLDSKPIARQLREKMSRVRFKIAVISAKGGVGKSTVSANLAVALATNHHVGVVDFDFDGPSIPRLLRVKGQRMKVAEQGFGIIPVEGPRGIKVISTGFVLDDDEAIVWMGSLRERTMEQFLALVEYGTLDYLVMDLPPGTSAETFNLLRLLPDISGIIVVTIASKLAHEITRRAIKLCQEAGAPVLGLIENMSGVVCPTCNKVVCVVESQGEALARSTDVPFLGKIPLDCRVFQLSDDGKSFLENGGESPVTISFKEIVTRMHGILSKDDCIDYPSL